MSRYKRSPVVELWVILFVAVVVGVLCVIFDLYEVLFFFTRDYEHFEMDELIPSTLIVLSGVALFSYRRNKELNLKLSEVKQMEVRLKDSEEMYRLIVEHAFDGIFILQNGQFKFANSKLLEISGYGMDAAEEKNFLEFIHPEDRQLVFDSHMKRLNGEKTDDQIRFRAFHKNGNELFLVAHGVRIIWHGEPAVLCFIKDNTEAKKLENRLRHTQKMEAIGTLAGGVAHDLNNILAGILSYPEMMLMNMPDDDKIKKPLQLIQRSGKKAAAIVQDLLTLARRGVPHKQIVNLKDIIGEYLSGPECESLKKHHPKVVIDFKVTEGVFTVKGSSVHLSKVIMNLVSNAAEALPEGGNVTISLKNERVDHAGGNAHSLDKRAFAVLQVEDNGIGIDPEDLEKIYEPFYTKKKMGRSGTGLGMAVVLGTVTDHNGHIDVDSEIGKGSKFTVNFPIAEGSATVTGAQSFSIDVYRGDGERILIVDDVYEQRDIANQLLTYLGYDPVAVSSGEDAISYLQENEVDLILLDMIMDPGMDGLDTYERAIQHHPGIKAVIVSGFSKTDRIRQAQALGAGEWLKKPYTMEYLAKAVKNELGRLSI